MFAYATSQSTDVSCSWARAPPGNARSPSKIRPMPMISAIDGGFNVSPPPLPGVGRVELLRVLHPLQHKIIGRQAGQDPLRVADDPFEVHVVPDLREEHTTHAPAGAT